MSIKKQRIVILICALLLVAALSTRFPNWDSNRDTPGEVARSFVSSVQAGDFDKARGYWSDGSVENIERFYGESFADFCRSRFDCREFRIGTATKQKGENWTVRYRPHCRSSAEHDLYVAPRNGVYRLIYEVWEPPKPGEPEAE